MSQEQMQFNTGVQVKERGRLPVQKHHAKHCWEDSPMSPSSSSSSLLRCSSASSDSSHNGEKYGANVNPKKQGKQQKVSAGKCSLNKKPKRQIEENMVDLSYSENSSEREEG